MEIALDIGHEQLFSDDESKIARLRTEVMELVFPVMKDEIKSLYNEEHRQGGGVLSWSSGEPIKSYITRRRRWYQLLT